MPIPSVYRTLLSLRSKNWFLCTGVTMKQNCIQNHGKISKYQNYQMLNELPWGKESLSNQ